MKVNATIDGNYILNKDVFSLSKEQTLYSDLPVYMRMEMDTIMKLYPFDNIFFVSDSRHRWRTKIYQDYKSTREPKEGIDWVEVYRIYDEFKAELALNPKIKMYEVDSAEGDDLIAYIVTNSNKLGYSNLIIASDGDLHQLLKFDLSKEYINLMYNMKFSDERTYLPKNANVFLTEKANNLTQDLFDMNDDGEILAFIKNITRKTLSTEVSDEESLFVKLISGDRKDFIPSVYIKNERGIGKDGAKSLYSKFKNIYKEEIDFKSDLFLEQAVSVVAMNKKITDELILTEVKNNLILNRQLIILDEFYLPEKLLTDMKNMIVL